MHPSSFYILKQNYSFIVLFPFHLTYEAVTLYGHSFQNVELMIWNFPTPHLHAFCKAGFSLPSTAFTRVISRIEFLSFPAGTKSFQFPAFACISAQLRKSQVQSPTCDYPGLIAACHVLRRYYSQAIP